MDSRKISVRDYEYSVVWSSEDEEYAGLCLEFPYLSWMGATPDAAITGVMALVEGALSDAQKRSGEVPEPLSRREFSGRFQLRTTPALHARLVREAQRMGVSLNALVNEKLATGL